MKNNISHKNITNLYLHHMRLSHLIKQADDLFRKFMLNIWGAPDRIQCTQCKFWFVPEAIEVGHVIARGNYATRWKRKNVVPLCTQCNQSNGSIEHLCDHVPNEDFEELYQLSRDSSFRLTESFIREEMSQYE